MSQVIIRQLQQIEYSRCWHAMKRFTDQRNSGTPDELWVLEHPPVFTQGQAGKPEHIIGNLGGIPLVQSDRGGQVTYHGPGQTIIYLLCNLRQSKLGIRQLVTLIEDSIVNTLQSFGIKSNANPEAHGVYINGAKIASLGLRVRKGCTYHGLSLNIDIDPTPFLHINPCGLVGTPVTTVRSQFPNCNKVDINKVLLNQLTELLGYTKILTNEILPESFHD